METWSRAVITPPIANRMSQDHSSVTLFTHIMECVTDRVSLTSYLHLQIKKQREDSRSSGTNMIFLFYSKMTLVPLPYLTVKIPLQYSFVQRAPKTHILTLPIVVCPWVSTYILMSITRISLKV